MIEFNCNKLRGLDTIRTVFISILSLSLVTLVVSSIYLFPSLERNYWNNYGLLFELLILIFLLFIFFILQFTPMSQKSYVILCVGLFFWIISSTIDVIDEVLFQPLWLSMWGEDLLRTIGMFIGSVGVYHLINQVYGSFNKVKHLATIDELTELPNRRYFRHKLDQYEQCSFIIMLIDLDHFKKINDSYGHDKGDSILHSFGKLLSELTSSNHLAARLGGEEFAVFIKSDEKQLAENLSKKLLSKTRNIVIENDKNLSVSIGIALKKPDESAQIALKKADNALYMAKNNGRDRREWAV